jgi:hypothetical protein
MVKWNRISGWSALVLWNIGMGVNAFKHMGDEGEFKLSWPWIAWAIVGALTLAAVLRAALNFFANRKK